MSVQLEQRAWALLDELRVASTPWHVRGERAGEVVVETEEAMLVWEPRRVTPVYAVPEASVRLPLEDARPPRTLTPGEARRPVLDPSVPFAAHTAPGLVRTVRPAQGDPVELFAPEDPALEGRLLVDFAALDWFEEDQAALAHPRDPYHRIDVRATGRHVVMESGGITIVDTVRARMLAETGLPVRWYVPLDDVRVPLEPSPTTTACAYKGRATYRSARLGDRLERDVAWSYEQPLSDARDVQGLLGFYAERLDVTVNGVPVPRRGMGEAPEQRRLP